MAGWATAEDVQAITGVTVDDEAIQRATYVIEFSQGGRVAALDSTTVSGRNLYFLKLAVAYQTVWMAEQPDFFSVKDVSSYTQEGQSATFRPDALTLSPNARKCLKRLSWRGMRTIVPGRQGTRLNLRTADDIDAVLPYSPL